MRGIDVEWSIIVILSKWEERRVVAYTLAEIYTAKHKHREGSKKDLVFYFSCRNLNNLFILFEERLIILGYTVTLGYPL